MRPVPAGKDGQLICQRVTATWTAASPPGLPSRSRWTYRALRYMEGLTAEEVAEKLNTGKNSPARWCKQLNERLAVLLFGVDGLRRW